MSFKWQSITGSTNHTLHELTPDSGPVIEFPEVLYTSWHRCPSLDINFYFLVLPFFRKPYLLPITYDVLFSRIARHLWSRGQCRLISSYSKRAVLTVIYVDALHLVQWCEYPSIDTDVLRVHP
jgi:hypothetical protein